MKNTVYYLEETGENYENKQIFIAKLWGQQKEGG